MEKIFDILYALLLIVGVPTVIFLIQCFFRNKH